VSIEKLVSKLFAITSVQPQLSPLSKTADRSGINCGSCTIKILEGGKEKVSCFVTCDFTTKTSKQECSDVASKYGNNPDRPVQVISHEFILGKNCEGKNI
jgi:hypothetical protein